MKGKTRLDMLRSAAVVSEDISQVAQEELAEAGRLCRQMLSDVGSEVFRRHCGQQAADSQAQAELKAQQEAAREERRAAQAKADAEEEARLAEKREQREREEREQRRAMIEAAGLKAVQL